MKNNVAKKPSKFGRGLDIRTIIYCSLLISAFTGIMCILNIITGDQLLILLTGIVTIWFLINIGICCICKSPVQLILAMMIGVYAIMMYNIVCGGADGFSIVWLLVIPPAVQYCVNSKYGIIFNLFVGFSLIIYLWTPLHDMGYHYSQTFQIRFPIVYFFVTFLCEVIQYRLTKSREEQETLIEHLEYASRTKNDFLANMSHEIRTPMNAIVGMCELILRDDINDEVRENCFNIQNSSRSLLSIINDILNFSKIEAGKLELIEEPFNLASTINDVINMAMTRKGDKDIEIIVRVDPTIPKGLIGDEMRIRQIIINLLTNAIKFTNKGCVVLKITQSRRDYGINLNVSVKDTGIGISDENIEKLFTSFQQVDTRKNRAVEGTGLGLAICKRLIAQMHGFINVTSTYGEGSEFRFVIPLKVADTNEFIQLKDADNINIAAYFNWKKYDHPQIEKEYSKLIHELGDKLKVKFTVFNSIEELKQGMSSQTFTHCFTAREEYTSNAEYFDQLAENEQTVVVHDRFLKIDLPANIKRIYKPFYALSFAAILNNEKYAYDTHDHRHFTSRFVAPEAKILLVDDNATNLKVAAGLMKPYNMKIFTVSSGQEAIDALATKDYDIVFMDHMMPVMDGVEATRIIRDMPGEYYKNLPIIALTANAVNGAREMFLSMGFNDFLAKPIEVSLLDRVLRSWLPAERLVTTTSTVDDNSKDASRDNAGNISNISDDLIDYNKGLMYAGNNINSYHEVLTVYTESSKKYRQDLIDNYEAKDWAEYTVGAHALKSSSLSIGAVSLSEFAKKVELAGKTGSYDVVSNSHADLIDLYDKVIEHANNYLLAQKPVQEPLKDIADKALSNMSYEQFIEKVNQITEACDVFDGVTATELCDELCSYEVNGVGLHTYFETAKKCVEDYDYATALETINSALNDVKEV